MRKKVFDELIKRFTTVKANYDLTDSGYMASVVYGYSTYDNSITVRFHNEFISEIVIHNYTTQTIEMQRIDALTDFENEIAFKAIKMILSII